MLCRIAVLIAGLLLPAVLPAQEAACAEVDALARMASARSVAALTTWKSKAGDGYRAQVVFAYRLFELHPSDRSAALAVVELIPKNDEQHAVSATLTEGVCDARYSEDVAALSRLLDRLPHDLARAVLLQPDKLPEYVAYANKTVSIPHSDYVPRMEKVCRAKHREFVKAVEQLPPGEKKWFLENTFNPDGCHPLHFPEAD